MTNPLKVMENELYDGFPHNPQLICQNQIRALTLAGFALVPMEPPEKWLDGVDPEFRERDREIWHEMVKMGRVKAE